jgi:hypothetical protein
MTTSELQTVILLSDKIAVSDIFFLKQKLIIFKKIKNTSIVWNVAIFLPLLRLDIIKLYWAHTFWIYTQRFIQQTTLIFLFLVLFWYKQIVCFVDYRFKTDFHSRMSFYEELKLFVTKRNIFLWFIWGTVLYYMLSYQSETFI